MGFKIFITTEKLFLITLVEIHVLFIVGPAFFSSYSNLEAIVSWINGYFNFEKNCGYLNNSLLSILRSGFSFYFYCRYKAQTYNSAAKCKISGEIAFGITPILANVIILPTLMHESISNSSMIRETIVILGNSIVWSRGFKISTNRFADYSWENIRLGRINLRVCRRKFLCDF